MANTRSIANLALVPALRLSRSTGCNCLTP